MSHLNIRTCTYMAFQNTYKYVFTSINLNITFVIIVINLKMFLSMQSL